MLPWPAASSRRPPIALNRDRIGHRYPPFRYEVSREKIREYAQATGVDDPIYKADPAEVPLADVMAPPTFAVCFALQRLADAFVDPEVGAHFNLVHGSQEFTWHRPVRGGDVLEGSLVIEDMTDRERMELLTLVVECVDAETKEPVVTARSVIILFKPAEEAA